jgi:putative selenate reductase
LDGPLSQELQILHVDELCNECGNCGFFCPYDGDPYALKPTLFWDEGSLRASSNGGFAFSGNPRSPDLVYRQRSGVDQPVERLPFATWQDRSSQDGMLWIAKTVVEQHPYLIPGGTL